MKMTNDEIRMSKEARMSKLEWSWRSRLVFCGLFLIRTSSYEIAS